YDDSHSIEVTNRTAGWNGALYVLDGKLTPGGTYRFHVWAKLLPGEPEAAANITLRQIDASGQATFRWLTGSVALHTDEWTELISEPFIYDPDEAAETAIYVELDHATASFLIDEFVIAGDRPLNVPHTTVSEEAER